MVIAPITMPFKILNGNALNSTMSSLVLINGRNSPNDGLKGTGNSKNANTYDIAASRAVIVIVPVETKFFLVLIVAVLLLINLLFVRYA